jgi:mono/diheme cytochrome c family protein
MTASPCTRRAPVAMSVFVAVVVVCVGCATPQRRPPLGPARGLTGQAAEGQVAFMEKCTRCHPGGEAGLGPALNNKPFPDFLKRFQVRHGLGVMPHFEKEELSDTQLDAILDYLKALHENPSRATKSGV